MKYSVWLDGTKIGETSLEMADGARRRAGVFQPTVPGLAVLPGITAMAPALLAAGKMCRENGIDLDAPGVDVDSATDMILERPEVQRIMEAAKLVARLELQGPRGEPILWESILISDMREIAALAARASATGCPAPGRRKVRDPMRYFISATLIAPLRAARC